MRRAMPGTAIPITVITMITPERVASRRRPTSWASARTDELLKLLTFLSPAFPVGAFSYSHGVEYMIDSGGIRSARGIAGLARRSPYAWGADGTTPCF